jgi:nucleotidyltransferase/DNA polymerase involved in DNA repair
MPGQQARELCPHLIFVSGHFQHYQRLGDAAIKVVKDLTPRVERISIDEAFADVAGCTRRFPSPFRASLRPPKAPGQTGWETRIRTWTGGGEQLRPIAPKRLQHRLVAK